MSFPETLIVEMPLDIAEAVARHARYVADIPDEWTLHLRLVAFGHALLRDVEHARIKAAEFEAQSPRLPI